mgnify:CR=1 FL=1
MKRPVRTHDARVANRRAVPVPVAFVRLKVNRRMDVARASCDRTPRARRSTRERSSERERRVRFGSIDRSIDRPRGFGFGFGFGFDLIFIRHDRPTDAREGREGRRERMATTMAAKEIEALTIASMASRDAVRAMRARGRRGGWSRERERERERERRARRAWRLRSVGFKRMHA